MEIQPDPMSDAGMIDIRERLRSRVDSMVGVSQREIARRAGITPQRLNNYMQRGTLPDVETLARLAKATGVSTDWLLGLNEGVSSDIAQIVGRLLELDGMEPGRAQALGEVALEAARVASSLPNEGDAPLRSRLAAQTVWQSRGGAKLS